MSDFRPYVTVIIPCYNYGHYLSECLESIMIQTYKNFEAIIVDDGSTDHTSEIANKFVKKDNRFKYIYQENQHLSAARNTGINNANGQYICFIDPDDIWFEKKLEVQIDYLKHNKDCGLLYSDAELYKNGKSTGETVRNGKYFYHGYVYKKMLMNNGVVCPSVIIKKECFDNCGLFRVGMKHSQDWEMWLRIARKYKFCSISKPLLYYRIHNKNNSQKNIPLIYKINEKIIKQNIKNIKSDKRDSIIENNLRKLYSLALNNLEIKLSLKIYLNMLKIRPLRNIFKFNKIIYRIFNA